MTRRTRICLLTMLLLTISLITGCGNIADWRGTQATTPVVVVERKSEEESEPGKSEAEQELQTSEFVEQEPLRTPVKVKGIYISAYVAGTSSTVDKLLERLDETEANALVIDFKDDFGRVACKTDSPLIQELGSAENYIPDPEALMKKLDEHDVYAIARIPAFRDAWLGEVRPDWCVKTADGSVFRDRDGNAWVNPYKREAWDYLVEIAVEAKRLGFEEVQFDYVRFCTESGMKDAVFEESDTKGLSRTDIICEFMEYVYQRLKTEGLFVSVDVFGAIINSDVNANSVGQIYGELAKHADYISPMIYPSHYGDGYYGIEHPDMEPYRTISAALADSRKELYLAGQDGSHIAEVRPWLQDFTATWLANHISYTGAEVRQQIEAVYDSGYDEWLLWDAACTYDWDGLLTPKEAEAEAESIAAERATQPETTYQEETEAPVPTGTPGPTVEALE